MRSLLFVPGDDERKIAKGLASAADALILDLEDAVAPARKAAAREICAQAIAASQGTKRLFVRVNALDTGETLSDLTAIVPAGPYGIVLPKCRGSDDVRTVGRLLEGLEAKGGISRGQTRVLPIATENGTSMFGLGTYADPPLPRLCGLMWGSEDLAADIGAIRNRDIDGLFTDPFRLARALCLYGAAAASVIAIDTVFTDFRDIEGVKKEAEAALRDGFSAKAAIHPDQVGPINAAFTPSAADIEWAKRVVATFETSAGTGVASLDGKMLDRPHLRAAQRILARAVSRPAGQD